MPEQPLISRIQRDAAGKASRSRMPWPVLLEPTAAQARRVRDPALPPKPENQALVQGSGGRCLRLFGVTKPPSHATSGRRSAWSCRTRAGDRKFAGWLFAALLCVPVLGHAESIDDFTVTQGPFTVGPGEQISEEEAILESPSVLGVLRIASPAMGDEATPGSSATMAIGGGEFFCQIVTLGDEVTDNGACGSAYAGAGVEIYDLTPSTRFEIEVLEANGPVVVGLAVFSDQEALAGAFVEQPEPGLVQFPFTEFLLAEGFDWSRVISIVLLAANLDGQSADVRLANLATDGAIVVSQADPPQPGDDTLRSEISGNYRDPARSGEGCQLTLELDGEIFVLTCYVYLAGAQVWMIGSGVLQGGMIEFNDMHITRGADFGSNFNRDDVERISFGSVLLDFADCNNLSIGFFPELPEFETITLDYTRIVQRTCGLGAADTPILEWAGTWRDRDRSGEGFQLAVEGDEAGHFVLTWYTYLEGEQVWLIGSGVRDGQQLVFDDMTLTNGADFGSAFDPMAVNKIPWGTIRMDIIDCNHATIQTESLLSDFEDQWFEVTKIVQRPCQE